MIAFFQAAQDMNSPPRLNGDSMVMRFPARLWRIVNSCTSGAIFWGPNGKTVRVQRHKFEREYLLAVSKPFKTSKFESFVRQLNHYGFKKVTNPIYESKEEATTLSEYRNSLFTRDRPEMIAFLHRSCRRSGADKSFSRRHKTPAQPSSFTAEDKEDKSLLLHPLLRPNTRQASSENGQDTSTCPVGAQPHPSITFLNFMFPKEENKPAALENSRDQATNGVHPENKRVVFSVSHQGDIQTERPAMLSFASRNVDPVGGMAMSEQDGSRDVILTPFQPPLSLPPVQQNPTLMPLRLKKEPPEQQLKFDRGLAGNSCSLRPLATGNAATKFDGSDAILGAAAEPSVLVEVCWPRSSPVAEASTFTTQRPTFPASASSRPGNCPPNAWLFASREGRASSSSTDLLNTRQAQHPSDHQHDSLQTATRALCSYLQQPCSSTAPALLSSAEETVLLDTLTGSQGDLQPQNDGVSEMTVEQTASWDTASREPSRLTSLVARVGPPSTDTILLPASQLQGTATKVENLSGFS